MIGFKDFLVTNPGMEKDAQIAYSRMKKRKSQDYGNNTEGARERIIKRFEKLSGVDMETRSFMAKKDAEWGEKRLKAIRSADGVDALAKVDLEIDKEKQKLIKQGKYVEYWK